MLHALDNIRDRLRDWFMTHAQGPYGLAALALIAFAESFIFPIPTVAFLVAILMAGSGRWLYYALFATFFSILGGVVGYGIGLVAFDVVGIYIINYFDLTNEFVHVQDLYDGNAFWVVLTGAFTPLPYKIFVLTAGFLKINFAAFVAASVIGRSLQFIGVAFIVKLFGGYVADLVFRYFTIVVFALFGLGILLLLIL